jgi:hypothetical protein
MAHVQLFLDWDGTLTKYDTMLALSKIGYAVHERNGTKLQPWDGIVQAYLNDLKSHDASYVPRKDQRKSIEEECSYLASLKQIEQDSLKRVGEAGVFQGVTAADLRHGAEDALETGRIEMRPGWEELFKLNGYGDLQGECALNPEIITVNWSGTFIRSCLLHAARHQDLSAKVIEEMNIWGNEIEGLHDRSTGSPGSLALETIIHTSTDKVELIKRLVEDGRSTISTSGHRYISVYVGDTATDFDALLFADVGICVQDVPLRGGQKELANTFERVGVVVQPLVEWSMFQHTQSRKTVYLAQHLSEIAKFVSTKLLSV